MDQSADIVLSLPDDVNRKPNIVVVVAAAIIIVIGIVIVIVIVAIVAAEMIRSKGLRRQQPRMAVERPQPHHNILTDLSQLDNRIDVVAHETVVVFVVIASVHSTCSSTCSSISTSVSARPRRRRRVFEAPSFQEFVPLLPTVLPLLVKYVEAERDVHGALPSLQNSSVWFEDAT